MLEDLFSGIVEGLYRPTLFSTLLQFLIISLFFLALSFSVIVQLPTGYLQTGVFDREFLATQKAFALQNSSPAVLNVTFLGASTLEDALQDEAIIGKVLSSKLNTEVRTTIIAVPGMRTWDIASFLDYIPNNYKGLIVVCLTMEFNPYKELEKIQWRSRFAIPSSSFRKELHFFGKKNSYRTGIYFLDHIHFFAKRCDVFTRALIHGPVDTHYRWMNPKTLPQDPEHKSYIYLKKIAVKKAKDYLNYSSVNFASLSRSLERVAQDDLQVIYLQPTRNIAFLENAYSEEFPDDFLARVTSDTQQFARENDISYLNLNHSAGLKYTDFRDYSHLNNISAKSRYTFYLIESIIPFLQNIRGLQ